MNDTITVILWLLLAFVETLPLFIIARKCGHEYAWVAFVPLANLWLMCDLAGLELWFILLLLVPYIDIIFFGVVWWRITENTNKSGWLGRLMLIPGINLIASYYIAFAEGERFNA